MKYSIQHFYAVEAYYWKIGIKRRTYWILNKICTTILTLQIYIFIQM